MSGNGHDCLDSIAFIGILRPFYFTTFLSMSMHLAYLEMEAAVVGGFCVIFLILFVIAGVRQIMKDPQE